MISIAGHQFAPDAFTCTKCRKPIVDITMTKLLDNLSWAFTFACHGEIAMVTAATRETFELAVTHERNGVAFAPGWLKEYCALLGKELPPVNLTSLVGRGHVARQRINKWNVLTAPLQAAKMTFRNADGSYEPGHYTDERIYQQFEAHLLACGWWLEMGVPVCEEQFTATQMLWRLGKRLRTAEDIAHHLPAMTEKLTQLQAIPAESIAS